MLPTKPYAWWLGALLGGLGLMFSQLHCPGTQIQSTGSTTWNPNQGWTVSVEVGVAVARQILPGVQASLHQRPEIPPATRQAIDLGLQAASDGLALATTALQTYKQAPTVSNQCKVHFYVEQGITGLLGSLTLIRGAGVSVPPDVAAAVGGLGPIVDMLWPGCQTDPGRVQHVSAQTRIQRTLGGLR